MGDTAPTTTRERPATDVGAVLLDKAATTSTELVVASANEPPDLVYTVLDKADEALIIAEIAGDLIETMAYEFTVSGQKARGLSYEGVNHAVRETNYRRLGRIVCPREFRPELTEGFDEEGNPIWRCLAYAEDQMIGGGAWGLATALRFPPKNNGTETYPDNMADRKALSKAQRNAKAALVPALLKVEILTALTDVQIKRVQTPRQEAIGQGEQQQQQRARSATAKPANRASTVTVPQQKLLEAKAKAAGITDEAIKKAIWAWHGGSVHLDRIEKSKVDAVLEAYEAPDLAMDEIASRAEEGDTSAVWIRDNVLQAGVAPGEQQTLG